MLCPNLGCSLHDSPYTTVHASSIGGNSFTGSIPDCIANLTNLQQLNLLDSSLSGVLPPNLFMLPELRILLISGANFVGVRFQPKNMGMVLDRHPAHHPLFPALDSPARAPCAVLYPVARC